MSQSTATSDEGNYQITPEIKRGLIDHTIVIMLAILFSLSYIVSVSHSSLMELASWPLLQLLFQSMLYVVIIESALLFYDVFLQHNREILGITSYFCAQSRRPICQTLMGHRPCSVSLSRMLIALVPYTFVMCLSMILSYEGHYNDRWKNEYSKVLRSIISQSKSDGSAVTNNSDELERAVARVRLWPTEVSEEYRLATLMLVPLVGREPIIDLLDGDQVSNISLSSPPSSLFFTLFKEIDSVVLLQMIRARLKDDHWETILSNGNTSESINESVMKILWIRLIEIEMNPKQDSVVLSRIKNLKIDQQEFSDMEALVITRLWLESKEKEWNELTSTAHFQRMVHVTNPMSGQNRKWICAGLEKVCNERIKLGL
jgi:hypothetical protein